MVRRGETDREREAREEEDSSMEDWADRADRAAVRRWAGEHFRKSGSSCCAKPGGNHVRVGLGEIPLKIDGHDSGSFLHEDSVGFSELFSTSWLSDGSVTPPRGL